MKDKPDLFKKPPGDKGVLPLYRADCYAVVCPLFKRAGFNLTTLITFTMGIVICLYIRDVNRTLLLSACALSGITSVLKSITIGIPEK